MAIVVLGLLALTSTVCSQHINFSGGTGTRSLWIPYKTISGVPQASIIGHDPSNNRTTYALHCPTAQPDCAIGSKIVLTEGTDLVRYTSSTSGSSVGTVVIDCPLTTSPVTCNLNAHRSDIVMNTHSTVPASEIVYQAVDVTAVSTAKKTETTGTGTKNAKATATKQQMTSSGSSTSTGGIAEVTGRPWGGLVGMVGAGVLALVAL